MTSPVPPHLIEEQRDLEAEIREAFKGVTREGGVSWHETAVIDFEGTDEQRAAARALDTEPNWEALVDDPLWSDEVGWSFLDGIGFRYYLPPAMVRCLRCGYNDFLGLTLHWVYDVHLSQITPQQLPIIARFVRFMMNWEAVKHPEYPSVWKEAYDARWYQFVTPHSGRGEASSGRLPRKS